MSFNVKKALQEDRKLSTIVYINKRQYDRYINSKSNFYLLFELSAENRISLLKIIADCLNHSHFRAIIFTVNKNEILFDRLFFLKEMTLKLFQNDKKVGIWGIPYCVMQSIFGGHYFSQLADKMIPENSNQYSKYIPVNQYSSSLLLQCHKCIASNDCDGLGIREENQSLYRGRVSHKYRIIGRNDLFRTDNEVMKKMYDSFCEHVDNSDLTYADRYLYFVKNIDFGSSYSFSDRFVYHCDFLPLHDYEKELIFLDSYIENKSFLPMINELAGKNKIGRIAYSKAQNENISRESFYIIPNDEHNYYLLNYFNINFDIKFPNRFFGVGVDFYNGQIKSYKVYFMIPTEILLQVFPHYFQKIDINVLELHKKEHYYIIRLDRNKKIISERIDLVYNDKDRVLYQTYFEHLLFPNKTLEELHIFALAFEFEDMDIKKKNIYYRNSFNHIGQIRV